MPLVWRIVLWIILPLLGAALVCGLGWAGEASVAVGVAACFEAVVAMGVEVVLRKSTSSRPSRPWSSEPQAFPPDALEIDPQPLLLAEFEYARETATQAMSDRSSMVGYFLVVVSIIAAAAAELLTFESGSQRHLPPLIPGILMLVLALVGWNYYLILVRLRQAWTDSALTMNRIKAFFTRYPRGMNSQQVLSALRWRPETLPEPERKWNVYHYSAMLLTLLNGCSLVAGTILIGAGALGSPSAFWLLGTAVALGLATLAYGWVMYPAFLRPRELKSGATAATPSTLPRTPSRVEVNSQTRLLDGFLAVDSAELRVERFDGTMSAPMTRLLVERGDAVAVLPYDPLRKQVVLIRQFRYPAYVRDQGQGWLWETIAGIQDEGELPENVARREALEETGYVLGELEYIGTVFPSPGVISERVHIYLAPLGEAQRRGEGGGLPESGEDIAVATLGLDEALRMVERGQIVDAKTVIALHHVASRQGRDR